MTHTSVEQVPVTVGAPEARATMAKISCVFFMWGFVTVLNDVLVPQWKELLRLSSAQTALIQFTFFSTYFLVSLPAARIISRIGYNNTIVFGLGTATAGALTFLPAAAASSFGLFLAAMYVLATGITILQVSANPYVTALGAPSQSSSRLSLVQALNSLGTAVGPWIGGFFLLSRGGAGQMSGVMLLYLAIALVLAALIFVFARHPLAALEQIEGYQQDTGQPTDSIWQHRHLILGAAAIFAYVGAEVAIGSSLVDYLVQPEIAGLTIWQASRYASLYWGGGMAGRFTGSALLQVVPTGPAVGVAGIVACLLVTGTIAFSGTAAMWSLLLVGLFNSIMFPCLFSLGVAGLGRLTSVGSGILNASIVGGAIIPLAQRQLAHHIGLQGSFVLPAICYLYLVFYGFVGCGPDPAKPGDPGFSNDPFRPAGGPSKHRNGAYSFKTTGG